MTQFNLEQLSVALSALGISVPKMDAPPAPDVRANASPDVAAGPFPNADGNPASVSQVGRTIKPYHYLTSAPAVQPAQAPVAPPPVVSAPAPTPSPSQPAALTAAAGPDGPWYVVSKGRSVGVFRGWQTVSNLVTGVGRVCFFRHGTRAAAEAVFNEALAAGTVEIL
ncbi:uncharacterized protein ARMOST_21108 [Armillaria ostoyae]|uniref:Ribonuclease H1 N-terminal domain-containing protein n=1 Tax=Armillaria ostoyae TaxID=47428 RepID=A0A284S9B6_ARMOS|nr:uncharacterized protein ARMOST_21108 [Armillaria ostoyae]